MSKDDYTAQAFSERMTAAGFDGRTAFDQWYSQREKSALRQQTAVICFTLPVMIELIDILAGGYLLSGISKLTGINNYNLLVSSIWGMAGCVAAGGFHTVRYSIIGNVKSSKKFCAEAAVELFNRKKIGTTSDDLLEINSSPPTRGKDNVPRRPDGAPIH